MSCQVIDFASNTAHGQQFRAGQQSSDALTSWLSTMDGVLSANAVFSCGVCMFVCECLEPVLRYGDAMSSLSRVESSAQMEARPYKPGATDGQQPNHGAIALPSEIDVHIHERLGNSVPRSRILRAVRVA